jgi:fumarylacetoacetate (FAA) hydrolase
MKFATRKNGTRDGELLIVSRDLTMAVSASPYAATMQIALDSWATSAPSLSARYDELNQNRVSEAFALDMDSLMAPLPRSFQFLDGSAYFYHMSVVRAARGAAPPADFFDKPLMYQGTSDPFLGPHEPLRLPADEELGIDIEAEIAVITDDVPIGTSVAEAPAHVKLITLLNDYSLRNVIPPELARGFGFVQGKCVSSLSPFALTPDELGDAWDGKLLHGRYLVHINDKLLGDLSTGDDASFNYAELIAHAATTRELRAGTVIGAGALANKDHDRHGSGCIAEERAHEQIRDGAPTMLYLRFGDRVRLEMVDSEGRTIFGAIDQRVEKYTA